MATQIDSLSIQISTEAGSSADKIGKLADELKKLKEQAGLTKVSNSLTRLAGALNTLKPSLAGLEVSKLHSVEKALEGFSGLQKATGLNSLLNSIKRLPQIVNDLDAVNLEKFAEQMDKLAKAMIPLATQVDKVARGFAKFPTNVSKSVTAVNRLGAATKKSGSGINVMNLNLMSAISNLSSFTGAINSVIQAMSGFLTQAVEWEGIQFRFGRAFGDDAEETYNWILKINEALGINVQEFMQYSSLYGSLLSGFGLEQEKITAISVGLTELSYDLWAAYNDRAKTLEDASEAVRSAITGEIEPIRNLGISLTEASLQEFIDSTHLAGLSIEKMTEAQKAEVRYAAMVKAAMNQGIIGTYAKEMDTAEGAVRGLTQSFKTLVQALGSLFIPILKAVVPYITAFVELLTEAVHWVANLFGIKIQAIDWSSASKGAGGLADGAKEAASGLGSAAKAAKQLKSYTMGFDELNVIDPNSGSGGGAGGALGADAWGSGLDLASIWDDELLEKASKQVDEIKEKIKSFFNEWKWGFALAGAALAAFAMAKHWNTIKTVVGTLISTIPALWKAFGGSEAAKSALTMMYPKLTGIVTAVTGFLGKITAPMWGTFAVVVAAIASTVYFLYENWDKVVKVVKDFFKENISPKLEDIKSHFDSMKNSLKPVGDLFDWLGKNVMPILSKAFEILGGVIFSVVGGVIVTAINIAVGVIENAIQFFSGIVQIISGVVQAVVALFRGDFSEIGKITQTIIDGVVDLFSGLAGLIVQPLVDFYEGVVSWFKKLWDELVGHSIVPDTINAIVDWFLGFPNRVETAVKTFVENVLQTFRNWWTNTKKWWTTNVAPKFTVAYWMGVFDTVSTAIRDKLEEVKNIASEKWTAIKQWFNDNVAPKLTKDYWIEKFSGLKEGFTTTIKNAINAGIDMMNRFIGWLNSRLHFDWDGLKIAGKEIFPGGSIQLFTIPSIPRLENGGFLEDGLFTMNRGEIAGKFNNGKSVVANNEQIIAGIAEGVYGAVVAAMADTQRNSSSGEQNINVYLDGKQIYASVKRAESQRGVTLMGNQLGYSY